MWNEDIKRRLRYCGENVKIGLNTFIINPQNVCIGSHVRIDPFTLITTTTNIQSYVHICSHCVLVGGVKSTINIDHYSFIAYGSKLIAGTDDYTGESGPAIPWNNENNRTYGSIKLEGHTGVATNCILLPNTTIPEGCYIGLNSVVSHRDKLDSWSIMMGDPPRFMRKRKKYEF